MWQPVHEKYHLFFKAANSLQAIVNEMTSRPVKGPLEDVVCRMVFAAANTYGALLTLALNGYGHDAMKLARSIYETELNVVWLKRHPEEVNDFLDYNFIQQRQYFDAMDEEQKKRVSKERCEQMMKDYNAVLPRFASGRDKARPRNEWCRVSIYDRAKEAEEFWREETKAHGGQMKDVSLYKQFYRPASSMHHGDIVGLIAQTDSELKVELAPSWSWVEDALVSGFGSLVRCVNYYDEIARLGFKERLEQGPNEEYVNAVKTIPKSDRGSAPEFK
jgi:hypothetical protein